MNPSNLFFFCTLIKIPDFFLSNPTFPDFSLNSPTCVTPEHRKIPHFVREYLSTSIGKHVYRVDHLQ